MPAVREVDPAQEAAAVQLERVEVEPGVFLKLNATDKKAYADRKAAEAAGRQTWEKVTRGDASAGAELSVAVVPLTILTRAELASVAEARGYSTKGSKDAIAARFALDAIADEGDSADDS